MESCQKIEAIPVMEHRTELLQLLKYFAVFRHVLTLDELWRYSSGFETRQALLAALEQLVSEGAVYKEGEYYMPEPSAGWVEKRRRGERNAMSVLPLAHKVGRCIGYFPFVRFVGISGSLSKKYADERTDFDFFIVAAPNTLWVCRSILHLLKKCSFLLGRQHWFCMNYFVDGHHLELEEKNIFTRIELSSLIPVYNQNMYRLLLEKNAGNLPNIGHLPCTASCTDQLRRLRANYQKPVNTWMQPLNLFLMKVTDAKWKLKWRRRGYPMEDYNLAFKTTPFVSKNHPKNFQNYVLRCMEQQSLVQ